MVYCSAVAIFKSLMILNKGSVHFILGPENHVALLASKSYRSPPMVLTECTTGQRKQMLKKGLCQALNNV